MLFVFIPVTDLVIVMQINYYYYYYYYYYNVVMARYSCKGHDTIRYHTKYRDTI